MVTTNSGENCFCGFRKTIKYVDIMLFFFTYILVRNIQYAILLASLENCLRTYSTSNKTQITRHFHTHIHTNYYFTFPVHHQTINRITKAIHETKTKQTSFKQMTRSQNSNAEGLISRRWLKRRSLVYIKRKYRWKFTSHDYLSLHLSVFVNIRNTSKIFRVIYHVGGCIYLPLHFQWIRLIMEIAIMIGMDWMELRELSRSGKYCVLILSGKIWCWHFRVRRASRLSGGFVN